MNLFSLFRPRCGPGCGRLQTEKWKLVVLCSLDCALLPLLLHRISTGQQYQHKEINKFTVKQFKPIVETINCRSIVTITRRQEAVSGEVWARAGVMWEQKGQLGRDEAGNGKISQPEVPNCS